MKIIKKFFTIGTLLSMVIMIPIFMIVAAAGGANPSGGSEVPPPSSNNAGSSTNGTTFVDITLDSYTDLNPLYIAGYKGQCTWYAWGRSHEIAGVHMPTGNAITWYGNTNLPKGIQPRTHSVAVFPFGGYGHVLFVENYNPVTQEIHFTESNYNNPCIYGGQACDAVAYARDHTEEVMHQATMSYYQLVAQYGNPIGFIYVG